MNLYPLVVSWFGLVENAPYSLSLYEGLDANYQLVWPGRLTTAFRLSTGPLGQTLALKDFEMTPQRLYFSLTDDHDLVEFRMLVATDKPYIRGTVRVPSDAHVLLWTTYDEVRLLGDGNFSLFVA